MRYELDGLGNVKREEVLNSTALGTSASVVRRDFDALGRLFKEIRIVNGADRISEFGYDAQGNLKTIQRPLEADYGEASAPLETRRYNALHQLDRIEDAQYGAAKPTVLTPDARDQYAGVQAANGATTTYQRDGFDQILTETSPDRGVTSYTYDAAGNPKMQASARGITTTHTWDALNRLVATAYTQSGVTSTEDRAWIWDANAGGPIVCTNGIGRLCRATDASGTTHHAYDVFGNLTQERLIEAGVDRTFAHGWDGEDRPSAVTTGGGRALVVKRDNEGRADEVAGVVAGAVTAIVKDSVYRGDGRVDTTRLGNDVVLDRSFDTSGAPGGQTETGIQTGGGDSTGDIPTAPEWAMIILGSLLMLQLARNRQRRGTLHASPEAVLLGLLALAALQQARANETLLYDSRGNIKSRTVDGRLSNYRYDKLDRLRNETGVTTQAIGLDENANRTSDALATYTVLANGNRLITRNGVALTNDGDGNLLADQTRLNGATVSRAFTYTLSGSLKTVTVAGALRATYTYNHQNQRTRKVLATPPAGTPATTLYRYDTRGHLLEEVAGSAASATGISVVTGQTLVTYVWKDETPSAVIYAPNSPGNPSNVQERIVYLHTDHLETPRKATDSQGRVVWTWESDAFGSTSPLEDPDGDGKPTVINLRFPGQYFDAESGLHYNWHRFYDPQAGRYTQSDFIGLAGGINTFNYANVAPTMYRDPDGLQAYMCRNAGLSAWCPPQPAGPIRGALSDFRQNYRDMRTANTIGADLYFHCKANCQASRRGHRGEQAACMISDTREWFDQYVKLNPANESVADQVANSYGRAWGSGSDVACEIACGQFRPRGLSLSY